MSHDPGIRHYIASEVAGFRKSAEAFGGFSNMAGGYPLQIGDTLVRSSEAFYQAMRFPENPDAQKAILDEKSPMMAKRTAYKFISDSRDDWHSVNVPIMRHALNLKLLMHRPRIIELFAEAEDRPIVEVSHKDDWWGAIPDKNGMLNGCNVLGRLLMEQDHKLKIDPEFCLYGTQAPSIPDYRLLGVELGYTPAPADPLADHQPSLEF